MADIKPRDYIIGILIFTLIIVGGVSLLGIFNEYDPTYTDDEKFSEFNRSFYILDNITATTNELEESITSADDDPGLWGILEALLNTGWNTLKLLFSSLSFMSGVFGGLGSVFGIPTFVITIILAIISTILAFSIFSAVFQKDL